MRVKLNKERSRKRGQRQEQTPDNREFSGFISLLRLPIRTVNWLKQQKLP